MINLTNLIISIVLGALSGFIASRIMNSKGGLLRNIIMGIIGSIVGTFLLGLIDIKATGYIGSVIVSVIGACIVIWIGKKLFK